MGQVGSVLGTVLPALNTATRVASSINTIGSSIGIFDDEQDRREEQLQRSQKQALSQLQQQQNNQLRDAQEQAAIERDRLAVGAQADEERRLAALRRAVSRQRVNFASQGIAGGGSTEAVLLGLFEESDDERQERHRLDSLRNRALDQDVNAKKRLNILQRSQLQEKQRLERASIRS